MDAWFRNVSIPFPMEGDQRLSLQLVLHNLYQQVYFVTLWTAYMFSQCNILELLYFLPG